MELGFKAGPRTFLVPRGVDIPSQSYGELACDFFEAEIFLFHDGTNLLEYGKHGYVIPLLGISRSLGNLFSSERIVGSTDMIDLEALGIMFVVHHADSVEFAVKRGGVEHKLVVSYQEAMDGVVRFCDGVKRELSRHVPALTQHEEWDSWFPLSR
jgi:hypothetical protein